MSRTLTVDIETSGTLDEAIDRFLKLMDKWIARVRDAYPHGIPAESHDGGSFMECWVPYLEAIQDEDATRFMLQYRDHAKQRFEQEDRWLDGYWRKQEVHHGTEHFDIFLRALWELRPDDTETRRQVEDAAEHIGNWKARFPAWYDWDTHLFHSMHLGTEVVGEPSCNIPDHLRMLNLCLLAYNMGGQNRYRRLAEDHGKQWATAINSNQALPVGMNEQGAIYELGTDEDEYRSFAGAAPNDFSTNLPRAENFIASGAPDLFLELWQHTGDPQYREAAEKIIDSATTVIDNPIAWQAQAAVRRYREVTGAGRYQECVRQMAKSTFKPITQLTMVSEVESRVIGGVMGMRGDKPDWVDQDGAPAPSPLLWGLIALVTKDENLLADALDLSMAHFQLAEQTFGDITQHGCGSRTLSAICRGHGRLNGAGVVTEVLKPALRVEEHGF